MKKTLIVAPEAGGHCPFYLSLIAEAFTHENCKILAPEKDREVRYHLEQRDMNLASFEFIKPSGKQPDAILKQVKELVTENQFKTVFFAYFDNHIAYLLKHKVSLGCSVTGIWFHPYALDAHYRWLPPVDKRIRTRGGIHRGLRDLKITQEIKHLFFLDESLPTALKAVNQRITSSVIIDPVEHPPSLSSTEARKQFGLPLDRTIFLHAGSSERRKGFSDVLRAFKKLSKDSTLRKKILLLRVGTNEALKPNDQKRLNDLIDIGMAHATNAHVPHEDFIEFFSAADWVVIPYRKFRFSSGIFANAVTSNTPVIASNYGMIGRYASQLKNGDVYRHKDWKSLASAIERHTNDRRNCTHTDSRNHSKRAFIQHIRAAYRSQHI